MYNLYLRVVVELVGDGEDVIGLRADRTGPIGVVNFNITYIKLLYQYLVMVFLI